MIAVYTCTLTQACVALLWYDSLASSASFCINSIKLQYMHVRLNIIFFVYARKKVDYCPILLRFWILFWQLGILITKAEIKFVIAGNWGS